MLRLLSQQGGEARAGALNPSGEIHSDPEDEGEDEGQGQGQGQGGSGGGVAALEAAVAIRLRAGMSAMARLLCKGMVTARHGALFTQLSDRLLLAMTRSYRCVVKVIRRVLVSCGAPANRGSVWFVKKPFADLAEALADEISPRIQEFLTAVRVCTN